MTRTGIKFIVLVSSAIIVFGGCSTITAIGSMAGLTAAPETAAQKAEREAFEAIIAPLSEMCEVDQERMRLFVLDFHEQLVANRVRDELLVTAESYHDTVHGALEVQQRYGFDRGPLDTCVQVAKDYGFLRPRDWVKRRQPARHTVRSIIRMITWESQGDIVRRIY